MDKYFRKLVISGQKAELFEYSSGIGYDYAFKPQNKNSDRKDIPILDDNGKEWAVFYLESHRSQYSNSRASTMLRQLVNANFTRNDSFWSFTFDGQWQDIKKSNYYFKKFIERLKYYLRIRDHPKLKYIAGVEFQSDYYHKTKQKKKDGGNVHYHVIMNVNVSHADMWRLWADKPIKYHMLKDDGFYCWRSKLDGKDSVNNCGAYFTKHLKKYDNEEIYKLSGQKKYFCSRGLKRPITFLNDQQINMLLMLLSQEPSYEAESDIPDFGNIKYKTFDVLYPDLYELVPEFTDYTQNSNQKIRSDFSKAVYKLRNKIRYKYGN